MSTEQANHDDYGVLVAEGYLRLADVLEAGPEERWDTPSLCEGWRVREVVAHMTMPARYDQDAFMGELRECGFDFTALSNRVAGRDGALPSRALLSDLRSEVLHRWTPPEGGVLGALSHVVIHSLDVTEPLGVEPAVPMAAIRPILDALAEGAHAHFGTDVAGRAFEASDIEWRFGSGPVLRAPAAEILLHLAGRAVPAATAGGA